MPEQPPLPAPILSAQGLVKRYDQRAVVDGVSLEVYGGEVLAMLGPNGAGKTTTLRMLYGYLRPDSGHITVFGLPLAEGRHRDAIKRHIGVVTQDDTLDPDFTVRENLEIFARYFRPLDDLPGRVAATIERFGLGPYLHLKPEALSGGWRRRLSIARATLPGPRLLFLDEPTTGLDPRARTDLWALVDAMRAEGMGVLLTTHYMDEAERLADRLLVLEQGRVVARGAPRTVIGDQLGDYVGIVAGDPQVVAAVEAWARGGGRRCWRVMGELHLPLDTAALAELSAAVPGARPDLRPANLDDLFLDLSTRAESR